MDYTARPVAVAWSDPKGAALYFDHVIPADFQALRAPGLHYAKILQGLLPPSLLAPVTASNRVGLAAPVTGYLAHYLVAFPGFLGIDQLPQGQSLDDRARQQMPQLLNAYETYVRAAGAARLSLYGVGLQPATGAGSDLSLVLANLDLIDTAALSWEQVLELRRDEAAHKALKRLRLFVYEDMAGKPPAYIRDKLEADIEAYRKAAKFWNFGTRKGLYTIGLSAGTSALVADAVGVALFGVPLVTAVAGASTLLGGVGIALESRRRELRLLQDESPVAFLVRAQDAARR